MSTTSFQARLTRWEVLNSNLKPHLETLPHLKVGQQELEQRIAEGMALAAQQSQLTAALRDVVVRRNELETKTNHLREYLDAALRFAFGATSQKLHEFEIRPRLRRSRTTAEPKPVKAPAPVTPQSNTTR